MENFLPINCRNELGVIVFYDTESSLGLEHAFLVILKGTLEIGLRYGGGEEGCDDMKNVSHVRMTKGHDNPVGFIGTTLPGACSRYAIVARMGWFESDVLIV